MKPAQKVLTTILWVLMVLAMISFIGTQWWLKSAQTTAAASALPVLANMPDFQLVDQDNQPVTLQSLRGKTWIADFVFTHCAGPCPMMTAKMRSMQKSIPSTKIAFVSFSVDPERDTPPVLKEYAAKFHADESRWKFLTGTKDAIFATARGMLITAKAAEKDNPIIHSERFVLIDRTGKIRGYYELGEEAQMTTLLLDAATVANEAQ
jgi:protein SCO1/2